MMMIWHVAFRVTINDALVEEVVGSLMDPRRALITSCHVVELCGPLGRVDDEGHHVICHKEEKLLQKHFDKLGYHIVPNFNP